MGSARPTKEDMIQQLRLSLHLNQAEFGERFGVSAMAVSRWERGEHEPPASAYIEMAKMAKSKTECWLFLGLAGFAKSELSAAVGAGGR